MPIPSARVRIATEAKTGLRTQAAQRAARVLQHPVRPHPAPHRAGVFGYAQDGVAVGRAWLEGAKDQEIEGSLEELDAVRFFFSRRSR
jgi:hypothetical protein